MADVQAQHGVQVQLVDGPVPQLHAPAVEGAGAVVTFRGLVRPDEDGRPLVGLDYSAYEPMAQQQLTRIATAAFNRHGLLCVLILHSRGHVPVGGVSLRLLVAAAHRKPAITAMDEMIDALKQDVPIWKSPVFAENDGGMR